MRICRQEFSGYKARNLHEHMYHSKALKKVKKTWRPEWFAILTNGSDSHLTICFKDDGVIVFYPNGDPARIEEGLRNLLKVFRRHPEAIKHAARSSARCTS